MFSRTTMASSMSSPMHSDSAISVRKFSVKPNRYTAMKVAITEIGSVRPVMMVLRHECRNRNTMKIVSSAPSTIVAFTPVERLLDEVHVGVDDLQLHVGRQRLLQRFSTASLAPLPTSTTLASCTLRISIVRPGLPLMRESESASLSPSTISATSNTLNE